MTTTDPASISDAFARNADRIRARADLTPEAKRARIAGLYLDTKRQLADAQKADADARTARSRALGRQVFGPPKSTDAATSAISYRDAMDRAASLKSPAEAAQLLAKAERSGDEALATAIAAHAHDNNAFGAWSPILQTYLEARPDKVEAFNEMQTLGGSAAGDIRRNFAYVLPSPTELRGMQDHHLQRLADDPTLNGA